MVKAIIITGMSNCAISRLFGSRAEIGMVVFDPAVIAIGAKRQVLTVC